jgi:hypothetical protein
MRYNALLLHSSPSIYSQRETLQLQLQRERKEFHSVHEIIKIVCGGGFLSRPPTPAARRQTFCKQSSSANKRGRQWARRAELNQRDANKSFAARNSPPRFDVNKLIKRTSHPSVFVVHYKLTPTCNISRRFHSVHVNFIALRAQRANIWPVDDKCSNVLRVLSHLVSRPMTERAVGESFMRVFWFNCPVFDFTIPVLRVKPPGIF